MVANPAPNAPVTPLSDLLQRPALSPQQVADLIGCSRMSVYNLITRGDLTARKVGSTEMVRIPTRQVLALLGVDDAA